MPLSLSNEDLNLLLALAEPIAYRQRQEFLRAVAAELANREQTGPGVIFRTAAQVQKRFVLQAQRVAASDMPQGAAQAGR